MTLPIKCRVLYLIEREIRIFLGKPFYQINGNLEKATYLGIFTDEKAGEP